MEEDDTLPTREFERFDALSDVGQRYTVVLVSKVFHFARPNGRDEEHIAPASYRLLDGRMLCRENPATFRIANSAERLRRVA